MKTTNTQGIPYPEAEDFVSPLQLQAIAELVNAKLVASHASYDQILTPETMLAMNTADTTGLVNGIWNTVSLNPLYADGFGLYGLPVLFNGVRPGTFQGGAYIHTVPSGAANANTSRRIWVNLVDYKVPGTFSPYSEDWFNEVYETSQGGEYQTIHFTFQVVDPAQAQLNLFFMHANTSSTLDIKADSYFWVTRIGDLGI